LSVAAATGVTALAAAALGVYATCVEPYRPVFRQRTLLVPAHWPRLDILHLSDLHLRRGDCRLFRAQMAAVGRLSRYRPDLICVTGDLCERVDDVALVADVLRPLEARLGMFLSLGNHEYNAPTPRGMPRSEALSKVLQPVFRNSLSRGPQEAEAIVCALRDRQLRVLRNEGLRLNVDGRPLWLGALDSAWAGRADPLAALAGRVADEGALVMVHEPEAAFGAMERGADVVLAGHTHGGQVRLPFIGAPLSHRLDQRVRIASGIQHFDGSVLHISAGFGQLVALRFACPPEAVWLHCVPATS
jgi:predicted MPP superfamily phosphohydrolase